VNVTLIMQLAPSPTLDRQLFVSAKSPLAAMLEILRGALPPTVSVTAFAALVLCVFWAAKVRLGLDSCTTGWVPVPVKLTTCGVAAAEVLIDNVPASAPVVLGVNLT
jgi:hypothetical protein